MGNLEHKRLNKSLRKARVRAKVSGTAERPRLSVFISNQAVSAQLIDDETQATIAAVSTVNSQVTGSKSDKAAYVGAEIAKLAKKKKIKSVTLDRNGRIYAGRLNALAEAARKEGLEF